MASAGSAVAVAQATRPAWAEPERLLFRISTENTADHVQTRAVAWFAAELQRRSGGRMEVIHHFGAALFRDRDVVRALRQGKVEMAVPGTWQLDRTEPNVGIYFLPAFYGRGLHIHDRLRDGPLGEMIARRLEDNYGVKVPGRWIDLGFAHVYGVKRTIASHEALSGMRIRVAGGEANLHRLAAQGAQPRVIPWTDLPQALTDGTVDGVLTTHETVVSGRLWEYGIRSAFEDYQYFAQYVPLVAGSFWARAPADLRQMITAVWEETVVAARAEASAAQELARSVLVSHGVSIVRPDAKAQAAQRARLMGVQGAVIVAMGLDEALVARAMAELADVP